MNTQPHHLRIDSVAAVLTLLRRIPEPLSLTVRDRAGAIVLQADLEPVKPRPENFLDEDETWSPDRCRQDICRTLRLANGPVTLGQLLSLLSLHGHDWNAAALSADLEALVAAGYVARLMHSPRPTYRFVRDLPGDNGAGRANARRSKAP